MRVIRYREAIRVDGATALSTYLSNDSPIGGRETDWLVTLECRDGLLFIVFTAPELISSATTACSTRWCARSGSSGRRRARA